jgi:thioredoxin-related protein
MKNIIVTIILGLLTVSLWAQRPSNTTQAAPSTGAADRSSTRSSRPSVSEQPVRPVAPPGPSIRPDVNKTTPRQTPVPSLLEAPKLPTYTEQMMGNTGRTATRTPKTTATTTARKKQEGRINWMTFEQALEKSKTEKRKVLIDVYTDWCTWCKRMDSTTFVSPAVANYINEKFYPVRFNAEQQQDIVFKDKTYRFKRGSGTASANGCHEIVLYWVNNNLKYPTVIFLDEQQNVIQALPGYQEPVKMEAITRYFGDDYHKKTPWESFERNFIPMPTGGAQE